MNAKERALALLEDAANAHAGDIFSDCFGNEPDDGNFVLPEVDDSLRALAEFAEHTGRIARSYRDDLTEDDEDATWIPPACLAGATDHDAALAFWMEYARRNRSHAEFAGVACGLLASLGKWDDLVALLTIYQGEDGFCWDS